MSDKTNENKCEDEPLLIITIITNVCMILALSISLFMLFSNMFLFVHKIGMQINLYNSIWHGDGYSGSSSSLPIDSHSPNGDKYYPNDFIQYYDCSNGVLSMDECNKINNYHDEFMKYLSMYISNTKSSSIDLNQVKLPLNSFLKVNTSFYIY
jgi:hypothetical protein